MRPGSRRAGHLWLVALLLVTAAALWLYGSIDHTVLPYRDWDLRSYLTMAEAAPNLAGGVHQPFCYRLLGPFLVGLLPLPESVAFRWLTTSALLGLAALFYRFLLAQQIAPEWAAFATAALMLARSTVGFIAWDLFQLNDILSLLQIVGLYWLMQRRHWRRFALLLVLGALTRETALLMVPVLPVFLWEARAERREWLQAAPAVIPAVVVFALLRTLVPSGGGLGLLQSLTHHLPKLLDPETWLRLLVLPFAPLTLVPLIHGKRSLDCVRDRRWHLALFALAVLASALFGQNNERLVAPLILPFYWLVAHLLQETEGRRPRWLVPATLPLLLAASLHHEYARYLLPSRAWTLALTLGSLALTTLLWAWAALRMRNGPFVTTI